MNSYYFILRTSTLSLYICGRLVIKLYPGLPEWMKGRRISILKTMYRSDQVIQRAVECERSSSSAGSVLLGLSIIMRELGKKGRKKGGDLIYHKQHIQANSNKRRILMVFMYYWKLAHPTQLVLTGQQLATRVMQTVSFGVVGFITNYSSTSVCSTIVYTCQKLSRFRPRLWSSPVLMRAGYTSPLHCCVSD